MINSQRLLTRRLILLSALFLFGAIAPPSHAQPAQELSVLIWADYMDPEVIAEFEKSHHVKVKLNFFVSDDDRDDIVQDNNAEGYDVVLVNGSNLTTYIKRGWLADIPKKKIANLRHIDTRFGDMYPESINYGVPYFWGTLGIAYRADLIDKEITRWDELFHPSAQLKQKIVMLGSARDLVGMALKAKGYSSNSESMSELKEAQKLLQEQSPYVKSYSYVSLSKDSALVTGEIVASMTFSGDAITLQQYNENIRYVVPEEGGNIWVDYLSIMSLSNQKALAMKFIDFLNKPEIAARQAQFVSYPTPNKSAEKFLPSAFLSNKEIYPPQEVLGKSETYRPISPRAMKKRHEILSKISKH